MKKTGFTLVELLAVIVILGIILLIAVPKVTATISNATDASMVASAKMLAASAEREFPVRQSLTYNNNYNGSIQQLLFAILSIKKKKVIGNNFSNLIQVTSVHLK